uniref:Pyr_redox_dim domain-containing protein n=1 Tax=Panagrellus redivivus TaxID=6233 RepID=A0A7E4V8X0_PANRE
MSRHKPVNNVQIHDGTDVDAAVTVLAEPVAVDIAIEIASVISNPILGLALINAYIVHADIATEDVKLMLPQKK